VTIDTSSDRFTSGTRALGDLLDPPAKEVQFPIRRGEIIARFETGEGVDAARGQNRPGLATCLARPETAMDCGAVGPYDPNGRRKFGKVSARGRPISRILSRSGVPDHG